MAREMTPQERAAAIAEQIVKALDVHPSPINIDAVLPWVQQTRRAALLEAAQVIEDDCYGGVDYFSDADTTLSFTDQMKRAHNKNQAKLAEQVRKLAQEG